MKERSAGHGAATPRRHAWITRTALFLGLLLAAGGAFALLRRGSPRASPNVLLISIDALRFDHLGAYGYERDLSPHIDRFAGEGTLFIDAISQATWTLPSVTSLFLSQYVSTHGIEGPGHRIPDEAQTLAEVLRDHGYDTGACTIGAYTSGDFGMDQGFDAFVSEGADAERRVEWMREWIAGSRRPFFLYAHFVDVHYPYRRQNPYGENYGRDYRGFVDGQQPLEKIAPGLGGEDLQHLVDLYDNGVAYADFHLGQLFAWLREVDLERNTLVILTADHGEAFLEHGKMLGHRGCPYEELIRVPLLMRGPGVPAGKVVSTPVEQIDLAPTILQLCGLEPGAAMQGRSLRPLLDGTAAHKPYTLSEFLPFDQKAIRASGWKLIADYKSGEHQLFDLRADAGELRDLAAEKPEIVRLLLSELARLSSANLAGREHQRGAPAELDPETREQLRALGYAHE